MVRETHPTPCLGWANPDRSFEGASQGRSLNPLAVIELLVVSSAIDYPLKMTDF
ncbi:MAG: hypothetical protein WBW55_06705 [Desulfobaccales bacterium]